MKLRVLALLTIVLVSFSGMAGEDSTKAKDHHHINVKFEGTIQNTELATKDAEVILYHHNDVIGTSKINSKGKFDLKIPTGEYYMLEIHTPQYLTTRIAVDATIKEGVPHIPNFEFQMTLVSKDKADMDDVDSDLIEFPVALVHFDEAEHAFIFDEMYTDEFIEERERAGLK